MKRLLSSVALLALAGCSGRQTMLDPVADEARQIDTVWQVMLAVCGFMYVLVLGFLAWALWRAARRRGELAPPVVGHSPAERALEQGLRGWAALIVFGLTVLVTVTFVVDRGLARVGPDPLRVRVVAHQWWWQVEYQGAPAGMITTANELHLPLGRSAVIELDSHDVIHSFWAPNLTGKVDLIPGRTNHLTITPRRTGLFRAQCAEFCGLQHAQMALDVTVDTPEAFEAWRQSQLSVPPPPVDAELARGRHVLESEACSFCHKVQGTEAGGTVGPDLTHLQSRRHIAAGALPNTRPDLTAWIADPQGTKPGTTMPRVALEPADLRAVVSYLETLR